jgi:ATP-dependent Lon protease
VGCATGLAWRESGGEIIFVETTRMMGAERLILTGYLGEVMKESAQAALSYIRSHTEQLGLAAETFSRAGISTSMFPRESFPRTARQPG